MHVTLSAVAALQRSSDGEPSHGRVEPAARDMLGAAMESLTLSARGFHRVLRVSRTIAHLEDGTTVGERHVAEALRYRPR